MNVYAPNTDSPDFFLNIDNIISNNTCDYIVICGDYNLVMDQKLDTCNYSNVNNPKAKQALLQIIKDKRLIDIFRHFYPGTKRYTWRRRKPIKQARLDYFLVSDTMTDIISGSKIIPGYRTDHSIIQLGIILNKFTRGKGIWKFNCTF